MGSLKSTQNSQCNRETIIKLSKVWSLKNSEHKLKFEVRLYSNSKRGLRVEAQRLKFETRLKLQNSKHWESPKLELSKAKIRVQIRESMNL